MTREEIKRKMDELARERYCRYFGAVVKSQGLRWLLGHRDSVITLKTYTHFVEDKKNDVQELASNIFGGGQ